MSNTSLAALVGVGLFAVLLLGGISWYVGTDSARLMGAAIGGGVALLNMAVFLPLTLRSLKQGGDAVMKTIVGGFMLNLLLVVVLTVAFHRIEAINATAFALTYVAIFFVFDGLKVLLVEKSLRRPA